jgi:hypothetical protein
MRIPYWRRRRANDIELNELNENNSSSPSNTASRSRLSVLRLRGGFDMPEGGALCAVILAILLMELVFILFNYYDVYPNVYPGSTIAQNLSGGKGTAFSVFKWIICWSFGSLVGFGALALGCGGVGAMHESSPVLACIIAIPFVAICAFVGTWQMWIYWPLNSLWFNAVWNGACQGWDGYAMLQGIDWMDVASSLPYAGTATVFLTVGNYSMQLERNAQNHHIFYFYDLQTGNSTPPFSNITYNIFNHTYTINNVTSQYTVSPNLAFPSLDFQLADPSIPFSTAECDMPLADLVYANGTATSNVLHVVNTDRSDCTSLKVCTNTTPQGEYEIALGVLLIQQFAYGVCCSAPSGSDSSSTTIVLSVNFGGGGGG